MLVFTPQFFNITIEKKERPFGQPKKKREKKEVDEERDKRKERE